MIISENLLDNLDLWLWDFDDTLIDTSVYFRKSMTPSNIMKRSNTELDKEVPSWRYFKKLVFELVKNGKRVGIVSFGTGHIIQAYMNRIFGINQLYFHRNNILALCRDEKGKPMEYLNNKNSYINTLMNYYRIKDTQKVVLFDDRMINIIDAATIGVIAVKIPGRKPTTGNPTIYDEINGRQIINSNLLFNENTIKKLDKGIKQICPIRHKFGAIGDRKVNSIANIDNIDLNYDGKVIEGFTCPCNISNMKVGITLFLALIIFIVLIKSINTF